MTVTPHRIFKKKLRIRARRQNGGFMTKKTNWTFIRNIIGLCLILCLLFLASCKENEQSAESTISTETTFETIEITDTDSIVQIFNTKLESIFLSVDEGENEGEQIISAMLPYLMSDTELSETDSFIINNFTTTGNASGIPDEVICHDGVLTYTGTDPQTGNYRTIQITNEDGTVNISTLNGKTSVTGTQLNPEIESIFGTTAFEFPQLSEADLTETEISGVYSLASDYARDLLSAVTSNFQIGNRLYKVPGKLDARNFNSDGILKLTLSGMKNSTDEVVSLEIVFYHIGRQTERAELILGNNESEIFSLKKEFTDNSVTKSEIHVNENGVDTLFRQALKDEKLELYLEFNAAETISLALEMEVERQSADAYQGALHMDLQMTESNNSLIVPLSADSKEPMAETEGEFIIKLKNEVPDSMDLFMSTTAGALKTDMHLIIHGSDVKTGETVMKTVTTVTNSQDPSAHSSSNIEIKLLSGTVENGTFEVIANNIIGSESSTIKAQMTAPADRIPEYTEYEATLIERAKLLLTDPEFFREAAQNAADLVAKKISQQGAYVLVFPEDTFYMQIDGGKGIVTLMRQVHSNKIYIYADLLLDVENYSYFYSGYYSDGSKKIIAGIEKDRDHLQAALSPIEYHYSHTTAHQRLKVISYYYNSEYDIYVLINEPNDTYYLTEEPSAEDYPGYAFHKVNFDENHTIIGDVHNFEITYDENCIETLICKECQYTLISRESVHSYTKDKTAICELNGNQPKTEYAGCERCDHGRIILTDASNDAIWIFTAPAEEQATASSTTGSSDQASWKYLGTDRDLSNCRIIAGVHANYEYSGAFNCDIIIPDLRESVGLTILGITFSNSYSSYSLSKSFEFKVVFPEGMEYIGRCGEVLFQSVTEIVLPETLRYVDELAFYGYKGESLVLPASLEAWHSTGFNIKNLKSLTIKGEYYWSSPYLWCPNLEELICYGTFDIFIGFATPCKIVEITIPEGVKTIGSSAFYRMTSLERVILPESLTDIGEGAFRNCAKLKEINIPGSVKWLGINAFTDCDSLKYVEILGVNEIPDYAFNSCDALEEVVVSDVISVGNYAFQYCSALHTINLPETAKIGTDAFKGCTLLQ